MRVALVLFLSVLVAASPLAVEGREEAPLAVRISPPRMIAPGRAESDVTIAGLQPEPHPTIEWTATVGVGPMIVIERSS